MACSSRRRLAMITLSVVPRCSRGPVLDGAHAFAGPLVVHIDVVLAHAQIGAGLLFLGVEAPVVVASGLGDVAGQGDGGQALVAHGVLVHRAVETGEEGVPVVVCVIDRHMHLGDGHGGRRADHEGLREDRVRDAHVHEVVRHAPQRCQTDAPGHGLVADVGLSEFAHDTGHGPVFAVLLAQAGAAELLAVAVLQRRVIEEAVQVGRVGRVYADLEGL
jgi:hypothetical protein